MSIKKGAFLASQVRAIIRNNRPPKFKDPNTTTIFYIIWEKKINNALLDFESGAKRPIFETIDAIIRIRSGIMALVFGEYDPKYVDLFKSQT